MYKGCYSTISLHHKILVVLSDDCLGQTSCKGSEDIFFISKSGWHQSTSVILNRAAYVLATAKIQPRNTNGSSPYIDYQRPALNYSHQLS